MNPQVMGKRSEADVREETCSLSPIELVLKTYDLALEGCDMKDADMVSKALVELIAALDFEYRDVAMGLFRLYEYCLRVVKVGDFENVRIVLAELRETWVQLAQDQKRQAV